MTTCKFDECDNKAKSYGLCPGHRYQQKAGKELQPLRSYGKADACRFEGCTKNVYVGDLCRGHRNQEDKGQVLSELIKVQRGISVEEKILSNIVIDEQSGCWIWQKYTMDNGYGFIFVNGKQQLVHRASYEAFIGPIPEGRLIDHVKCISRACANPQHLRIVTHKENNENRNSPITNPTGYRGVAFDPRSSVNPYVVRVKNNNKTVYGGCYPTAELAGEAARRLRLELYTHNDADKLNN